MDSKWEFAVAVAFGLAASWLAVRHRRRQGRRTVGAVVGSYEQIKERIRRGGDEEAPGQRYRSGSVRVPKSLEVIFDLHAHEFQSALAERIAIQAERSGLSALSSSEAAVLDLWGLEAEVNNGGFDQYFFNSAGDRASQGLSALELIGATEMAAIVRKALALFGPAGPSSVREDRWHQMDLWRPAEKEVLDQLSSDFQDYPDSIADLLEKHCRTHRDAFR